MKVLFISSSSGSRGGGELYLLFLGDALTKLGVEVGLWCSSNERMDELAAAFSKIGSVYRSDYRNTYDYKIRSLRHFFFKHVEGIERAVKDFSPDVIHLNKQNLEDGLDLLSTLDVISIPYLTTIHITQTQKSLGAALGKIRDRVARNFIQRAKSSEWIAISTNRAQDLRNFLGDKQHNVIMIPNGVKIEEEIPEEGAYQLRAKFGLEKSHLAVITVGRLESQKNPFRFVEWAAVCAQKNQNIRFFWIGDGGMRHSPSKRRLIN
ncbi:MAG: glycosyltransferase [Cyclobacteriaceae bacterium]